MKPTTVENSPRLRNSEPFGPHGWMNRRRMDAAMKMMSKMACVPFPVEGSDALT